MTEKQKERNRFEQREQRANQSRVEKDGAERVTGIEVDCRDMGWSDSKIW